MIEEVVLVNEKNEVLGTMPKSEVHGKNTPLHRGFSLFLFNAEKKLLVQQRSHAKKTWPWIWSNSCCGHPMLGESNVDAARRRLRFELGMGAGHIEEILPYRYRVEKDGVVENEICPILIGLSDQEPVPNHNEAEKVEWISWSEFLEKSQGDVAHWSAWCIEEAVLLEKSPQFQAFLRESLS